MKKSAAHPTTNITSDSTPSFGPLNIGREFVDTTWRIAVPVLIFTILGIFIDKRLGTKPWITLLGVLVGFVFAALLVKQQISNGDTDEDDKEQQK